MKVSVITPTSDRPIAFALTEQWMARQTRKPDEWIVADGGLTPVVCTQGQVHVHRPGPRGTRNFLTNLSVGLEHASGDVLVFWEDDDWYSRTHLETITGQFTNGVVQAAGDDLQQYYHVPRRLWRTFNNKGASLCQTAFRRELVQKFHQIIRKCWKENTFSVDGQFWAAIPESARSLERHQTVVGIKGIPGQAGLGIGHRPTGPWVRDPGLVKLRSWIGDDARVYASLTASVACP